MYFHSHVKAGKTHNKGTKFLEPKSWLHNRNLHQINFPQAAVSGLSMLRAHVRILEACTFLSRQLRIDSLHLRKWKDKNIGCCQRKFLDQVVVRKSCRVLYYFFAMKVPWGKWLTWVCRGRKSWIRRSWNNTKDPAVFAVLCFQGGDNCWSHLLM